MRDEKPRKLQVTFLRQLGLAIELPFVLVAAVVLGGGAGYWLDNRLHTSPALTFLLGALGFAAGVREVLRRIPREDDGGQ